MSIKTKLNLCAIILAAGNSSRFGSNKLLYKLNNHPMYEYSIKLIEKLQPACTIIVTKYPEISKKYGSKYIIVENQQTELGQSHSLKLAINKAKTLQNFAEHKYFDGYLFIVGDQPYLSYDSLYKLYQTWQKVQGICALSFAQKRGNPVIFSAKYLDELLQISGDKGGRIVIQKHLDDLTLVEVSNAKELIDIDTKEILNNLNNL